MKLHINNIMRVQIELTSHNKRLSNILLSVQMQNYALCIFSINIGYFTIFTVWEEWGIGQTNIADCVVKIDCTSDVEF